jgi:hypothetical protein
LVQIAAARFDMLSLLSQPAYELWSSAFSLLITKSYLTLLLFLSLPLSKLFLLFKLALELFLIVQLL